MIYPDFVQIPRPVLINKNLRPTDMFLFGYLYWFCQLRLEKCLVSNEVLADMVGVTVGGVKNSLSRLEQEGLIKRDFAFSDNKQIRKGIKVLVEYSVRKSIPSSNDDPPSSNDDQNKNIKVVSKDTRTYGSGKSRFIDGIIKKFEEGKGRRVNNMVGQRRAAGALLKMKDITYVDIIETLNWYFSQEQTEYTVQISDLVDFQRKWNKLRDLMEINKPKPGSFRAELENAS